ncbi:disulfide bond formation protein B [Ideonella sp.]|uniref:disulfide bond formation protein B n=1 Tax=Ideonella sp. TaxID=1929293 RepID=UPI0035B4D377
MAVHRPWDRPALWLGFAALASWGGVALALLSQYRFDMPPCPWCTLQRLIFLVIGALAVLALALRPAGARRALAAVGLLLSLSGVAAALWQHFVAAASDSCALTFADRLMQGLGLYDLAPSVFVPMASCADAAVDLLGIPYAFWSLALFVVVGAACARAVQRS